MKRFLQIVCALSLGVAMFSGSASAQADCTITGTGPGSNNECTNNQVKTCVVKNNNVISVDGDSSQEATSGVSVATDNTNGGDSESGDASNNNEVNFTGTVVNGLCVSAAVTPTPGQGGGTSEQTPAAVVKPKASAPKTTVPRTSVKPALLPATSGASPVVMAMVAVAGVSSIAAVSKLGLLAYGRIKS